MIDVILTSARNSESKTINGRAGDQRQIRENDFEGEVSSQHWYLHTKGWRGLRAKDPIHAEAIAFAAKTGANNHHIGYSQDSRLGIITNLERYGTLANIRLDTNCDCSSFVRACVIQGCGRDAGNFNTANEVLALMATGLFTDIGNITSPEQLALGDIIVTATKGHTCVVTNGKNSSLDDTFYPKYNGTSNSIIEVLTAVGETDTSFNHRRDIAVANDIMLYTGTAEQNIAMCNWCRSGVLKKAK